MASQGSVVVFGGYGYFGRLLVEDLLSFTSARISVAGRRPPTQSPWNSDRVRLVACDQHDRQATTELISAADVVIHCAGPYQDLACDLLRTAISAHVPYIDLADSLDFFRRAGALDDLATQARVPAMVGMSFVPGLAAIMVGLIRSQFDRIDAIRSFAAPGTRSSRGSATYQSLLSSAGRPIRIPRGGRTVVCSGWSEPERVDYPPPVGLRTAYLAMEVADFDLFPEWFGARSVEFKAGSEFAWLNRLLYWLARFRAVVGVPPIERLYPIFSPAIRLIGLFGVDSGAAMVEVSGVQAGREVKERVAVVAHSAGPRIAIAPAAIAAQSVLTGKLSATGPVRPHEAFDLEWFVQELQRRGLEVWTTHDGAWTKL